MPNRAKRAATLATAIASSSKNCWPATVFAGSSPYSCSSRRVSTERPHAVDRSSTVRLAPLSSTALVPAPEVAGAPGDSPDGGVGAATGASGETGSVMAGAVDAVDAVGAAGVGVGGVADASFPPARAVGAVACSVFAAPGLEGDFRLAVAPTAASRAEECPGAGAGAAGAVPDALEPDDESAAPPTVVRSGTPGVVAAWEMGSIPGSVGPSATSEAGAVSYTHLTLP